MFFYIGNMPRKTFDLVTEKRTKLPLTLPENITVHDALDRVLRLVNVASKRYLTNKVSTSDQLGWCIPKILNYNNLCYVRFLFFFSYVVSFRLYKSIFLITGRPVRHWVSSSAAVCGSTAYAPCGLRHYCFVLLRPCWFSYFHRYSEYQGVVGPCSRSSYVSWRSFDKLGKNVL